MQTQIFSSLGLLGILALAPACNGGVAHASAADAKAAAPFATPPILAGTPDIATLVAKVKPAVVNITVVAESAASPVENGGDPFQFFGKGSPFGGRFPMQGEGDAVPRRRVGQGSGFIVDAKGHAVTNAHVVDGAKKVKVRLADDREFTARVVGVDTLLDLAVIEIEGAKDLPLVSLGSSDALRVGEYVVAIGNPFGLNQTVTMGIASAKARTIGAGPYDDFIQTDASINPGNSGGPLFNLNGQVVGINTAINPQGQGIGFAIPVDALKDVLPQLIATGSVARGRLGVHIQHVSPSLAKAMKLAESKGALVADVEASGPAARAGIAAGDVVVAVDGDAVGRSEQLPRLVARHRPGTQVTLDLVRSGAPRKVVVTLDSLEKTRAPADEPTNEPARPEEKRAALGVVLRDGSHGVLVERVVPGGAAEGELQRGDVIVEVDRAPVSAAADVSGRVKAIPLDKPVLLTVHRGEATIFVAIDRKS